MADISPIGAATSMAISVISSVPTNSGTAPKISALTAPASAPAPVKALCGYQCSAEQELVERHLLEEAQRFEDQRQHDADRRQDRHHRAGDQEDPEDALDDMAGAIGRRDARLGPDEAGDGEQRQRSATMIQDAGRRGPSGRAAAAASLVASVKPTMPPKAIAVASRMKASTCGTPRPASSVGEAALDDRRSRCRGVTIDQISDASKRGHRRRRAPRNRP